VDITVAHDHRGDRDRLVSIVSGRNLALKNRCGPSIWIVIALLSISAASAAWMVAMVDAEQCAEPVPSLTIFRPRTYPSHSDSEIIGFQSARQDFVRWRRKRSGVF